MKLTRAQRLAAAGVLAPHLRSQDPKKAARRINRIDKDGAVVGSITAGELAQAMLARERIEFDVTPDTRPDRIPCELCERPFRLERRPGGQPRTCPACRTPKCLDCDTRVDRPDVQRCKPCSARHVNAPRKKTRPCRDCGTEIHRTSRAVRGGGRCEPCEMRRRAAITTCPRGHDYTLVSGRKRCRPCEAAAQRRRTKTVSVLCPTITHQADDTDYADSENKAYARIPDAYEDPATD